MYFNLYVILFVLKGHILIKSWEVGWLQHAEVAEAMPLSSGLIFGLIGYFG